MDTFDVIEKVGVYVAIGAAVIAVIYTIVKMKRGK